MKDTHIEKIKSRGYWRIYFSPLVAKTKLEPIGKCREMVEKNSVNLTGWDYPHIPKRTDEHTSVDVGDSYYQGWIDWEQPYGHVEFWRMYQTGQFIHYFGLVEDWCPGKYRSIWERTDREPKPGDVLGVTRMIYFVTNIYQFLSRLTLDNLYDEGVKISLTLNNTKNRELIVDHQSRLPFTSPRRADIDAIVYEKTYTKKEIIEDTKEITIKAMVHFFERFKWDPPNMEVIKTDYDNLISGKI